MCECGACVSVVCGKALVGISNRDTLSFWEFEIWLYVIFGLIQILVIFQIKK